METKSLTGLEVIVGQWQINRGWRAHCSRCPVTRAIRKSLGHKEKVFTTYDCIDINNISYEVPKRVRTFMVNFDLDGKLGVKPFKFRMGKRIPQ